MESLYYYIEQFFMSIIPLSETQNTFIIANYDKIIAGFSISLITLAFASWILLALGALGALFSIKRRF